MANVDVRRGDIFFIRDNGAKKAGSEQHIGKDGRPGIIVSNNTGNEHAPIVSVVLMTTQEKTKLPTHAEVFCKQHSIALCEQVQTVSKSRLGDYITSCTDEEMEAVDEALAIALNLDIDYDSEEMEELKTTIKVMEAELNASKEGYKMAVETINQLTEDLGVARERVIAAEEKLLLAGDTEQITVYEPEDDSFYKQFYNDLFHSDKKIEIKVG